MPDRVPLGDKCAMPAQEASMLFSPATPFRSAGNASAAEPLSICNALETHWYALRAAQRYAAGVVPVALEGTAAGTIHEGRFQEIIYRWTWTFQDHVAGAEMSVDVSSQGARVLGYRPCARAAWRCEIDPSIVAPPLAVAWKVAMAHGLSEVPFDGPLAIRRWRLCATSSEKTAWIVTLTGGEEETVRVLESAAVNGSEAPIEIRRSA